MKIAIIHFQPIEYYPPVHNFIRTLANTKSDANIKVYTSHNAHKLVYDDYGSAKVYRSKDFASPKLSILRYVLIAWYYLVTIFRLIKHRPDYIMYYETYSCLPAYYIKKLFNKKAKIIIHYHEYLTPAYYHLQMKFFPFLIRLEKELLKRAFWISHTNAERLELFKAQYPDLDASQLNTFPNFPPKAWDRPAKSTLSEPVKLVYIGALSTKHMYTKEVIDWVNEQNGKFTLDIYSLNVKADVYNYIRQTNSELIVVKESIPYDQIPDILEQYDVGLVIYNGDSKNYIYNAPNKLFEYHATGIDVWFSSDLITSKYYKTANSFPKIVEVDFNNLSNFKWQAALSRENLDEKKSTFFCETVYASLIDKL